MATQLLEFNCTTGLTLTVRLFAVGSDTAAQTASSVVEKNNNKNRYVATFTDVPAGTYQLNAFVGSVGGFANEVYDLKDASGTFQPRSEAAGAAISVLPGRDRSVPSSETGEIVVYVNEIVTIVRSVVDGNGNPMDLSVYGELQFVVEDARGVNLDTSSVSIAGADDDTYSFETTSAMTNRLGVFEYSLNEVGGARVCGGKWIVRRRAL